MKLPRGSLAVLGFVLIWAFLILFILYPLIRIFYDAVTNEAGEFTLGYFSDFFTDSFYLRSFWRSMDSLIQTLQASRPLASTASSTLGAPAS